MVGLLWERIVVALTTVPDARDLGLTAVAFAMYAVFALPIGFFSGFLQWQVHTENRWQIVLQTLVAPALFEEIVFRGLLLPHPGEGKTTATVWLWSSLSLFLFVIYHPINGVTLYNQGYFTFRQPVFLGLAALLGVICTVLYLLTGSLWPSVVVHWFVVVVWLGWLGGIERLVQSSNQD